jgi:ectoine hydroxylase-related dioxygenase (phytanoyl-CoA dioxygenase family)
MEMKEALEALGVKESLLKPDEKHSLNQNGFVLLHNIMDRAWLEEVRKVYEELMAKEGAEAGKEVHQEEGTRRLADLVNKSPVFDRLWTHPKILACVQQVLKRPFKLSSLNARDAEPGQGHQALHADWGSHKAGEPFQVVNSVWMIDDFTLENGATRIIPGSHLKEGSAEDHLKDVEAPHPDEVLACAPAGSVLVFNAHAWHGGTKNTTKSMRRACHGYFTAREQEQQLDQRKYVRPETMARLSEAAKFLLDVL